jgi:hypothetical protein
LRGGAFGVGCWAPWWCQRPARRRRAGIPSVQPRVGGAVGGTARSADGQFSSAVVVVAVLQCRWWTELLLRLRRCASCPDLTISVSVRRAVAAAVVFGAFRPSPSTPSCLLLRWFRPAFGASPSCRWAVFGPGENPARFFRCGPR